MGDKKLEEAAVSILTRAVSLDKATRYTEALVCYQEGLQLLMDNWKGIPPGSRKDAHKKKIEEYMQRAELIKQIVSQKKESGTYHEEIFIKNDSKGHSYETIMGRFLDSYVEKVKVEDPYLRNYTQFCNLIHFCELVVSKCSNLEKIEIITGPDEDSKEQLLWFNTLKNDLKDNHNVNMEFQFSTTLHDRQILLSNGWVIKIGRGLDIFKPPINKHGMGKFNPYFRPCRETKVDIYHEKSTTSR